MGWTGPVQTTCRPVRLPARPHVDDGLADDVAGLRHGRSPCRVARRGSSVPRFPAGFADVAAFGAVATMTACLVPSFSGRLAPLMTGVHLLATLVAVDVPGRSCAHRSSFRSSRQTVSPGSGGVGNRWVTRRSCSTSGSTSHAFDSVTARATPSISSPSRSTMGTAVTVAVPTRSAGMTPPVLCHGHARVLTLMPVYLSPFQRPCTAHSHRPPGRTMPTTRGTTPGCASSPVGLQESHGAYPPVSPSHSGHGTVAGTGAAGPTG